LVKNASIVEIQCFILQKGRSGKDKMKHIQVLMSAYNGEKYLKEQIESILRQTGVKVSLLIRDDGSEDNTVFILEQYSHKNEAVQYYKGSNIGAQKSFFDLLHHADRGCDYFAFADQDDYWLPEKLKRAVDVLEQKKNPSCPLLYGSMVIYASEDLADRRKVPYKNRRAVSFGNALAENIFMGCTEVFNRSLLELAAGHIPVNDVWHDWWLYLSAACFGQAVYDEEAYILYRQHGNNQLGMQNSWIARWKNRIGHFKNLKRSLSRQAQEFIDSYGADYQYGELAELLANYRSSLSLRIRLAREKRIYRQQKIDDRVYHLLFLMGLL
jgi:glycosyltransferase involved in cell wall biosynthesis